MALWNRFPFSNFHQLNLDWLIQTMKELVDNFNSLETKMTQFTDDINKNVKEQNKKIDNFVTEYTTTINNIPEYITEATQQELTKYREDGTLTNIIESTYGAVSYLNVLQGQNLVVLGDSLSASRNGITWFKNFTSMTKGVMVNMYNYAVSGAKLAEQADKFEKYESVRGLSNLIIWCGINDVRDQTSLQDMRTALDKIRTKVQSVDPKCHVYLFSTYKNYRGMPSSWVIPQTAYWRLYSQYATENGWTFVDLFSSAPVIAPSTDTLLSDFYTETDTGYLHYTEAYAEVLARYILNVLVTQSPVPLGDYFERVPGTQLASASSPNTSVFEINQNGSFVDFGTRFVHIRIAGVFKAPDATQKYTKILTLPYCFRPKNNSNYTIAYRSGGDDSVGGQFSAKALLKADGSVMLFNTTTETQTQITSMTMFLDFYLEDVQADWRRPQSKS